MQLACSWTAFSPASVRVAGLALNRNIPCEASVAVPLHKNALRRLSITRFSANAELLMQKNQLVIELASCLR
jgi:hypothetical protein